MPDYETKTEPSESVLQSGLVEMKRLLDSGIVKQASASLMAELANGAELDIPSARGVVLPSEPVPALFRLMGACGYVAGLRVATWPVERRDRFMQAIEASPGFHPDVGGMRYHASRLALPGCRHPLSWQEVESPRPPVLAENLIQGVAFEHIQEGINTGLCDVANMVSSGPEEGMKRAYQHLDDDRRMGVMGSGLFETALEELRPEITALIAQRTAEMPLDEPEDDEVVSIPKIGDVMANIQRIILGH